MIYKGIEFLGRFDFSNEDRIKFAWSGCMIKANFYGSSVKVKLRSTYAKDYFVVIIDNKIVNNSLHIDNSGDYLLAENLTLGIHTIELVKKTEFNIGTVEFLGFDLKDGYLIDKTDTKFTKRIEIIGDSLTCGFGSEGDLSMEYDPKYDNAYLTYGLITARNLNADCRIIACSGYGLIRNYGGNMENTMPTMVDKITPLTNELWDYSQYTPDVVVINLGTNDFSCVYIPQREQFVSSYIKLINKVKSNYKNVKVICSIGPVLNGEALKITKDYVNEVINHFSSDVYYLEYELQNIKNGIGISYHPSLKTHQIMANTLTNKVNEIIK